MKRNIFFLALLGLLATMLFSCAGEEDDIFSDSAADRLTKGAETGRERLMSSPAGWAMEYYPIEDYESPWGLGYLILADYDSDGSVTMGMKNQFSSNVYIEDRSAWEVITDDGIVLTHNTWNDCIHAFCDPEDMSFTVDYDETGYGCEGDYEFIMIDLSTSTDNPEYMMLKGKKRGIYVRLTRLEEGTNFQEYIEDVQAFTSDIFQSSAPNYLVLTIDGDEMQVEDMSTGIPNIFRLGGDAITEECYYPCLMTRHNGKYYLRFREEVVSTNGYTLQELYYDEARDAFVDVENEENTLTGPEPDDFFFSELEMGNGWYINRSSDMSSAAKEIYEEIYSGLSAMRYTLQSVRLSQTSSSEALLTFVVRNSSGGSATAAYIFSMSRNGNVVNLSYVEPDSTSSANVLSNVPTIMNLINALSGGMIISSDSTRMNLSTVKLSSSDGNMWFVFTLN